MARTFTEKETEAARKWALSKLGEYPSEHQIRLLMSQKLTGAFDEKKPSGRRRGNTPKPETGPVSLEE